MPDTSKLTPEERNWYIRALAHQRSGKQLGPRAQEAFSRLESKMATETSRIIPLAERQLAIPPQVEMQESRLPGAARLGLSLLPAAGATVGSFSPAPIPTATLLGAGGRAAQQLGESALFGEFQPSPQSAAADIAKEGLFQGSIEALTRGAGRLIRGPRVAEPGITSGIEVAAEEGIPLTAGQKIQSAFLSSIENVTQRALGGGGSIRQLQLRQLSGFKKLMDDLLNQVSTGQLSRSEAGENLARMLEQAESVAGKAQGAAEANIIRKTGNSSVDLSGARAKILSLLSEVERLEGAVPGAAKVAKEFRETLFPVGKQLDFETAILEAKRMRSMGAALGKNRAKSALSAARGEILDAITNQLDAQWLKAEAQAFRGSRARVKAVSDAFKDSLIKKMVNDKGRETIGAALTGNLGITHAQAIKRALGGELPDATRKAFLEEIFNKATTEGVITKGALEQVIKTTGEDTVKTVLKPGEAAILLERLEPLINIINLPQTLTQPISGAPVSLLALGVGGLVTGGVAGQLAAGKPATGALVGATTAILTPLAIARVMTSGPGRVALAVLFRAGTPEQATKALFRVIGIAKEEMEKEQRKQFVPSSRLDLGRPAPLGATLTEHLASRGATLE